MTLNRDTFIAIGLLLMCGGLMMASLDIREPDYGQLSPAAWPRAIIAAIAVLSGIYLVQSLRTPPPDTAEEPAPRMGPAALFQEWRNVISVFVLFLAYLVAIPWLGMLISGMVFVFCLLSALGGLRSIMLHAVIAVISMGGMWLLFTYALDVILPRGEWTGF
ncbi:MAG: tripartite tricarboxylate transporter TctB family protein [Pseudomonadota bacterium]